MLGFRAMLTRSAPLHTLLASALGLAIVLLAAAAAPSRAADEAPPPSSRFT
jgi:hypothetical protein